MIEWQVGHWQELDPREMDLRSSRLQRAQFVFQFEGFAAHVAGTRKTKSICRNEAVINNTLSLFLDQLKICDERRIQRHIWPKVRPPGVALNEL